MMRFRGRNTLDRTAVALRRAPGRLRSELTRGLRDASDPAVKALRRATETADVSGRRTSAKRRFTTPVRSRGLRRPMARAIEADISTSATGARADIRVRDGSVPPRIRRLVKYVLGDSKRWRHPVMGRRSRWASQNAPNVWWRTLRPMLPRYNREVQAATNRTENQLRREAG
jgi:hypothetical protein